MTLSDLRRYLAVPRVAAFLRVIREKESSQTDAAYFMRWPGKTFTDLSRHPNILEPIPGSTLKSSAAGAYQITGTTWRALQAKYGFTDFSRQTQDCAAVELIAGRGALQDVLAGRFESAVAKCRQEWTSLPGAAESRAAWTMDKARAVFLQYGGTLSESPPPKLNQRKAEPMGAGLIVGLVQALIQGFAPKAEQIVGGALEKHGIDSAVGQTIVKTIADAVSPGIMNAPPQEQIEAFAAASKSATTIAAAESSALDYLDKMAPMLDKMEANDRAAAAEGEASRVAAAIRSQQIQKDGAWGNPAFIISLIVMSLVAFVVASVLWKDAIARGFGLADVAGFSTDMQSFVIGAIVGSALTAILGFFVGSTRQSQANQVVMGEIAARRV
jgi:muramidase (phage lysozyme)